MKISNQVLYHKQAARELVEATRNLKLAQDLTLKINDESVTLCAEISKQKTCFSHAFTDSALLRRSRQTNQALIRACNNRKKTIRTVLDLTAGWARDSFILAWQGQRLTMVEQHPLIYHIVDYLLHTAAHQANDSVFERLHLLQGHGLEFLSQINGDAPGCIYLDPMFPEHKSGARPGKELQILQLLTVNQDIEETFTLALQRAGERVVVKRPLHAAPLNDEKPDICYREKTVRFDVYLTKG